MEETDTLDSMQEESYAALKLENQLCFPLYACAKEVVKAYKPSLDTLSLTYTQYITMLVLWEHQTLKVKELGRCLYLDSSTLTPLLKRLEEKGYVTRCRSKEDERDLIVSLTEDGWALRKRALDVPAQIASCIPLDSEKAALLYETLYELLGKLNPGPKKKD